MRMVALVLFSGLMPAFPAHAQLAVEAPALSDGGRLPKRFAGPGAAKKCDGENVSPALRWRNLPKGARSVIISITDLDGYGEPNGAGFVHWLAYAIPASKTSLVEGEANRPSSIYLTGRNTFGDTTYSGPCPQVGKPGAHQYAISVTALSIDGKNLKPGLNITALFDAVGPYLLDGNGIAVYYPGDPPPQRKK